MNAPGAATARRAHGLEATDVVILAYLVASGLLLLLTDPDASGFVPLVVRAALFLVFFALARSPLPDGRAWNVVRRVYPIALFPYFYAELETLNRLVTGAHFDTLVIAWEQAMFRSQPSVVLREWIPSTLVSEYLHFAYFSYYFIPTFTVVFLATRGKLRAISETMTSISLTFVVCYVFFILFPMLGPYHTFLPPDPATLGRVFPAMTHAVVSSGSSPGTAFPSSHCAVATMAWIQAFRHDRAAGWILAPFVPALIVGTVYGGFHYALDAIAGVLVAFSVAVPAWRLYAAVERRRTGGDAHRAGDGQRMALARRS